jgi:hypothetical protein
LKNRAAAAVRWRRPYKAEQRDELAAPQFIELHSIQSSQGRFAGYRMGRDQSAGIGAAIGTKRQTPSAKRMSPALGRVHSDAFSTLPRRQLQSQIAVDAANSFSSTAAVVVQQTHLQAYIKFVNFRGEANLRTWLTRIALNDALSRRRRQRSTQRGSASETISFCPR